MGNSANGQGFLDYQYTYEGVLITGSIQTGANDLPPCENCAPPGPITTGTPIEPTGETTTDVVEETTDEAPVEEPTADEAPVEEPAADEPPVEETTDVATTEDSTATTGTAEVTATPENNN